jgi:tetraacyldisaccharide-1-P 4'-kinase
MLEAAQNKPPEIKGIAQRRFDFTKRQAALQFLANPERFGQVVDSDELDMAADGLFEALIEFYDKDQLALPKKSQIKQILNEQKDHVKNPKRERSLSAEVVVSEKDDTSRSVSDPRATVVGVSCLTMQAVTRRDRNAG